MGRATAVNETSAHERLLDTLSDGAMLDHEYVLYASQRIIGQRNAGSSMGQVTRLLRVIIYVLEYPSFSQNIGLKKPKGLSDYDVVIGDTQNHIDCPTFAAFFQFLYFRVISMQMHLGSRHSCYPSYRST